MDEGDNGRGYGCMVLFVMVLFLAVITIATKTEQERCPEQGVKDGR
jgi:uncharacterized membrane protein